ncbi:MAG: hypothetical protein JSU96_12910 [Acidobacteriota bacterium]|nr:MAG: hypothetical protein JSU96_12910 [Acidobacteriota bacterium]
MNLLLAAVGFTSILGQVVILRELGVAFYGVELIYLLSLGIWLFWTSMGALVFGRREVPSERLVIALFPTFGLLLFLDLIFIRGIRTLFGGIPGTYLGIGSQLAALTLAILPLAILLGLQFQWVAKYSVRSGGTLAGAYAVESVGGLVGGITATLLMTLGFQNFTAGILCALAGCSAPILVRKWPRVGVKRRYQLFWALLFTLPPALLLPLSGALDRRLTRINHPHLVETRDSPYSRITITEYQGQYAVYENDILTFETETFGGEELVSLAALSHPSPRQILVIGGGSEGIVAESLKQEPDQVLYLELNSVLLELFERVLPPEFTAPLKDRRVKVVEADPRKFLDQLSCQDLILVGMPPPDSGLSNRYFTQQFFKACAPLLNEQGIVAIRLGTAGNVWTELSLQRNAAVVRALESVFPSVLVFPGESLVILASRSPLPQDPAILVGRLHKRGIQNRLVTEPYLHYLLTNDRFEQVRRQLSQALATANSDDFPVCYRFSNLIWLSKFAPALINSDLARFASPGTAFFLAVLAAGVIWLAGRGSQRISGVLLVFLAGLSGMIGETVLVLQYQTTSSVLFQNLGLVLTLFMLGLAVGAWAVNRVSSRLGQESGLPPRLGAGLCASLLVLNLMLATALRVFGINSLVLISFLLFLLGTLTAAIFAFVSLLGYREQTRAVSPLYSADLAGGCLGSMATGLILVPFFGLSLSLFLVALLVLPALPLVARLKGRDS